MSSKNSTPSTSTSSTNSTVTTAAAAAAFAIGKTARAAANEKVIVGVIGSGGRGSALARMFSNHPQVDIGAVCDPQRNRMNGLCEALQQEQELKVEVIQDYRKLLERKDIDAVIVATPDHWHAPATIAACQAGKDVYVEKPASHNIWEGKKMVEAARKYKRIVQVGTQNRSSPYVHLAHSYIASGRLGTINLCKVNNLKSGGPYQDGPVADPPEGFNFDLWLGAAKEQPYRKGIESGWYYKYDFCSGDMGSDGIHQIDIARWLIGKHLPVSAQCYAGNFAFDDDADVPDTQVAYFDFEDCVMTFEMTEWAPYMAKISGEIRQGDLFPFWPQCSTRIELYGSKELMVLGRHGGGWQVFTTNGEVVAQEYGRPGDTPHIEDFVQCIKDRTRPNADILEGHLSASLVHLANISYRVGCRKINYDPEKEAVEGDEEANQMLKGYYREAYAIPEKV